MTQSNGPVVANPVTQFDDEAYHLKRKKIILDDLNTSSGFIEDITEATQSAVNSNQEEPAPLTDETSPENTEQEYLSDAASSGFQEEVELEVNEEAQSSFKSSGFIEILNNTSGFPLGNLQANVSSGFNAAGDLLDNKNNKTSPQSSGFVETLNNTSGFIAESPLGNKEDSFSRLFPDLDYVNELSFANTNESLNTSSGFFDDNDNTSTSIAASPGFSPIPNITHTPHSLSDKFIQQALLDNEIKTNSAKAALLQDSCNFLKEKYSLNVSPNLSSYLEFKDKCKKELVAHMQTDKSLEFDLGKLKQEKQSIGQANSFHVEKVLQEKEQELHQLNLEKGGSLADRIKKRDELNANIKIAQDTLAKVKTSIKQAPIVFRGFIWLSTYSTTNKLNRQVSSAQKELKLLNNTIAEQNESLIAKEQQLQKTIKYLQEKVSITQITATGVNVDVAFANKQIKEKKKNQEVVSAKIEHLQSVIEHMQDNIEAVQAMTISSPMTPEILVSKKKFSRAVGEGSNLLNQFDEVVNSSDNSSGFNANVQEKEDTPELNNTSGFNQQSVNSSGFCPSCSCC